MLCHKEFWIKAPLQNAFYVRLVFSIQSLFFQHSKQFEHNIFCFYAIGQITPTGSNVIKVYNLTEMSGSTTLATTQTPLSIYFVMLSIDKKKSNAKNFSERTNASLHFSEDIFCLYAHSIWIYEIQFHLYILSIRTQL